MGRGCYGCFGPSQPPNTDALAGRLAALGMSPSRIGDTFRFITGAAPAFRDAAARAAGPNEEPDETKEEVRAP
jgi:hypothetical protein